MLLTLCVSLILILPTIVSLLIRHSFQTIIVFGWGRVPWLSFCSFGPWYNSFNPCRTLHALDASLSCICASYISLYALFWLFLHLILFFWFVWVKIQNHIKSEKFKKFDRTCLSTYHMWVLPCTFVQMTLCIYELSLFFMHLYLCGRNLETYVTVVNRSSILSWMISEWFLLILSHA